MDYKERYNAALERMKSWVRGEHPECFSEAQKAAEFIFPELKENEDERIRKELIEQVAYIIPNDDEVDSEGDALPTYQKRIDKYRAWLEKQEPIDKDKLAKGVLRSVATTIMQYLDSNTAEGKMCLSNMECEDIENAVFNADWAKVYRYMKKKLEKLGEQKPYGQRKECEDCQFNYAGKCEGLCQMKRDEQNPADEVEPKFKVGDWVVLPLGIIAHIESLNSTDYQVTTTDGKICDFKISKQDNYHLWSIADAKDGDVLVCESGWTCIFKTLVNDENFSSYCFMDDTKWFCETGSECHTLNKEFMKAYNGEIKPATKEQRDALMKAMADAGWEFDFEKKELKKKLDADKVIEWLKTNVYDDSAYGKAMIEQFKKDFGL